MYCVTTELKLVCLVKSVWNRSNSSFYFCIKKNVFFWRKILFVLKMKISLFEWKKKEHNNNNNNKIIVIQFVNRLFWAVLVAIVYLCRCAAVNTARENWIDCVNLTFNYSIFRVAMCCAATDWLRKVNDIDLLCAWIERERERQSHACGHFTSKSNSHALINQTNSHHELFGWGCMFHKIWSLIIANSNA